MNRREFLGLAATAACAYGCAGPLPDEPSPSKGTPAASPSPSPFQVRALAHMCTWHRYGALGNNWDEASVIPVGGPYDSLDPAVLNRQLGQMKTAGIAPLVSWCGPQDPAGDTYLNMLVSAPASGVPAAILYEGEARLSARDGWYDFDDAANRDRLTDDLAHLNETYFQPYRERFMRQDDRFVVMLWPTHVYRGAFADFGRDLMRQMPLFLVSTDLLTRPFVRPDAADIAPGFAAVSAYGIYLPEVARELGSTLSVVWLDRWQAMAEAWNTWLSANAPDVKLSLPLEFAFDDTKVPGRNNPVLETDYAVVDEMIRRANGIIADSGIHGGRYLPWCMLKSWNEWFEGSGVEPSVKYGTRFMDAIRSGLTL